MTEIATKEDIIRQAHAARIGRSFFTRVALTAIALIIWFWSQKLIGARGAPTLAIGDRLHTLTVTKRGISG